MSILKKIVVIGGTGLIGSKLVALLRDGGHEVIAASPRTGINALTGEGLVEAMSGTDAVIDVSNIASFDGEEVRNFFETSARNLIAAEKAAKVRHHVTLSIVGITGEGPNGYLNGKVAQENAIKVSGLPYTILRATQFYEFVATIADSHTVDGVVRLPDALFQPVAADDVAAALAKAALSLPVNGTIDLAGPDRASFEEIVGGFLKKTGDARRIESDASTGYFGVPVSGTSMVPKGEALIGPTTIETWFRQHPVAA